jgi:hypothetical protein
LGCFQAGIYGMTNKIVRTNRTSQFNRSGTVHYRLEQHEDGAAAVMLTVDFERAPTPEHTYVADFFEVSRAESDVLIVFGKIDLPGAMSLRNKIEIYFPFQPFVYQLWKSSRQMHEMLEKSATKKGYAVADPSRITSATDKVQTLATNNALIVIGGGLCMIDFFLIAAKDLWIKTRKGDPLNMDALVRVYLNERILLGFLDRCDVIAQDLIKELGITFAEENDEDMELVEL